MILHANTINFGTSYSVHNYYAGAFSWAVFQGCQGSQFFLWELTIFSQGLFPISLVQNANTGSQTARPSINLVLDRGAGVVVK
jgi:hypothetical protein